MWRSKPLFLSLFYGIDQCHLCLFLLYLIRMLSEEESNDRFEDADENEDGKVTWAEYVADSFGIHNDDDDDDENDVSNENSEEDKVNE